MDNNNVQRYSGCINNYLLKNNWFREFFTPFCGLFNEQADSKQENKTDGYNYEITYTMYTHVGLDSGYINNYVWLKTNGSGNYLKLFCGLFKCTVGKTGSGYACRKYKSHGEFTKKKKIIII